MKRGFTLLLALFMVAGLFQTNTIQTKAATKENNHSVVATIKGKKVYYNSKTKFLETKSKKRKYQKLSKKKIKDFKIQEQYVYYTTNDSKIYRVKANGKNHKKYNVSGWKIEMVKGGYIYYHSNTGFYRISTKGKNKKKLLTYSQMFAFEIVKDRIYYIDEFIGEYDKTKSPYQTLTATLYSIKLDGTDKKTHKVFDGNCDAMIGANSRYVFAAGVVGNKIEFVTLDTNSKNLEVKVIRQEQGEISSNDGHVIFGKNSSGVIDGLWYYAYNSNIYTIDIQGNQKKLIDISKYETDNLITVVKEGKYLKSVDDYNIYVYKKNGTLVKKITNKNGKIRGSEIKGDKITVTFYKNKKTVKKTFKLN